MLRSRTSVGSTLFVVCLCLAALANVRFALRGAADHWRPAADYSPAVLVPRFAPLAAYLPVKAMAGYVLDEEHANRQTQHANASLALAQYCLAPRMIERSTDRPLVIVDADSETPPRFAQQRRWTLVADLHNGVRLYRTERAAP